MIILLPMQFRSHLSPVVATVDHSAVLFLCSNNLPLLQCSLQIFPCFYFTFILTSILDGFTPLMLASFRGQGLDTDGDDEGSGEGENDDKSTGIITNLLMQGAAINARTDRTGKLWMLPHCICYLLGITIFVLKYQSYSWVLFDFFFLIISA